MKTKNIHYLSGLIITVFVLLHLINHTVSIWGADAHIEMMHTLRTFYRNGIVEVLLLGAVFIQIISGLKLVKENRGRHIIFFDKIHVWSGLYLVGFFLIHVSAVLTGRLILHLDTNFYFGAAGLNTFPFNLFFIPYYALAVIAFFAHLASVHAKKMKVQVMGISPKRQAIAILIVGLGWTFIILYGMTNHFTGIEIPEAYNVLIGK